MYDLTIGLEIHLKLNSSTKLFCACSNVQDFISVQPNTHICPVCTAQPGALPVLQPEPVDKTLLLARALKCSINNPSLFDRKSYFYPDLPMGYQITQFYRPVATDGAIRFYDETYTETSTIGIHALQIETDTAKTIHDGDDSFIDFNRAATPLVEIVTKPDFTTAEQVSDFLKEIQRIARFNNIGDADLEKGQMRVDVNISLKSPGSEVLGTRVEIKNINTFSNIRAAIDAEYQRQSGILDAGGTLDQETRRRNTETGSTITMRSKEDALDYRYFPEPDLPPLLLTQARLDIMNEAELTVPGDFIQTYVETYGFHKEYINVLLGSSITHRYFHDLVEHKADPALTMKWLAGSIAAYCKEHFIDVDQLPFGLESMKTFLSLVHSSTLSSSQAKIVMKEMLEDGKTPESIVKAHGFDQAGMDADALSAIVTTVIASHPDPVNDYKAGKESAIKFLMGQVMRQTKGQAAHEDVLQTLKSQLSS